MQSDTIGELAKALVKAQSQFEAIKKGKTADIPIKSGGSYSYAYADFGSIVQTVLPVLKENGLAYTQFPSAINELPALTTTLLHESGEWISETMLLHIAKDDAQGQGSAITYARRYALSAVLGIVTEVDDDGATASHQGATSKQNAAVDAETGEIDPRIAVILASAESSTQGPLVDIAEKYKKYGKLSEAQLKYAYDLATGF